MSMSCNISPVAELPTCNLIYMVKEGAMSEHDLKHVCCMCLQEEKTEGKATVDLLGSYVGKSGASWIMQVTEGGGAVRQQQLKALGKTPLKHSCVWYTHPCTSIGKKKTSNPSLHSPTLTPIHTHMLTSCYARKPGYRPSS
jgi:hypothetical protein